MSYFRERIFLDYMDFHTGNARPLATLLKDKEIKLKLDVLAFPKAQFCVAAPAIAKCHDTAYLLGRYSSLWSTNRLKYVLDPRYQGNFSVYVDERIKKLQSSFREDSLSTHFEYLGYTSRHWSAFFNGYIPNDLEVQHAYTSRVKSGDACFREETRSAIVNDDFYRFLSGNTLADVNHITRIIENKSNDQSDLFQREAIVRDIEKCMAIESKAIDMMRHELDNSFSRANAAAAGCDRSDDMLGINGRRLSIITKHIWISTKKNLYDLIYSLSPSQIMELSEQSEWQHLVAVLDDEIKKKHLDAKGSQHLLTKRLISMLPSRYFAWLQEVAAVIIAYWISPLWGNGAVSRYLGAIFTNAPTWILSYLGSISNPQLTVAILGVIAKVRHLTRVFDITSAQPLSDYGLLYVSDKGFVEMSS